MSGAPSRFSRSTAMTGTDAIKARTRYLKVQAAAWTILAEQHKGEEGPSGRAKRVASASLEIGSKEEWRKSRILVQQYLAGRRAEKGDLPQELGESVVEQLEQYATHPQYWTSFLEILLEDADYELEQYMSCMSELMVEVGDTLTQADLNWNLSCLGLPPQLLPMRKTEAVTKKTCWVARAKSFKARVCS